MARNNNNGHLTPSPEDYCTRPGGATSSLWGDPSSAPEWSITIDPSNLVSTRDALPSTRAAANLRANSSVARANDPHTSVTPVSYPSNVYGRSLQRDQVFGLYKPVGGLGSDDSAGGGVILRLATPGEAARSGDSATVAVDSPSQVLPIFPEPPNFSASFFADFGDDGDDSPAEDLGLAGDGASAAFSGDLPALK